METKRPERLIIIAFIVSTILAGNNAIAVRFSNAEFPPFFGAGVRFAAAALILFLITLILRLPLPKGRSLFGVLIFGVLQFGLSYALIYWSLLRLSAGLFMVVLSIAPLFTFFFAILHGQESFQWRILAGGLLAVGGIAVIFRDQITGSAPLLSLLAAILAAACVAESIVLFKTFPKSHPITTNAFGMAVGALILLVISPFFGEVPQWPSLPATWIAVAYLILLGSIGTFVLALYVLSRLTASVASFQGVLMPIVTIIFASWLADETVTGAFLVGGLLVLIGVYVGALAPADLFTRVVVRHPIKQYLKKAEE
jgi:drug/metabolite transporter (DMT)-like permease